MDKKVLYQIENLLGETGYKVIMQKPDGLCLLKAVHDSIAVFEITSFQKKYYLEKMRNEFTTNWERLSTFITTDLDCGPEDDLMNSRFEIFDNEIEQYVNPPGGWQSKLVDLVVPV